MPRTDVRVVVFAKAPEAGTVKTRLVPPLNIGAAAALHERLIARALTTSQAAALGPVDLACAPDTTHPFFQHCAARRGTQLIAQTCGDLGTRMHAASRDALEHAGAVILIGCDCPALKPRHLREAAAALARGADAVFGPVEDGGYALVGLTRVAESLFRDIEWGSATVMHATRTRLSALGWRAHELETLWDVDRPADYARLVASGLLDEGPEGGCAREGATFEFE